MRPYQRSRIIVLLLALLLLSALSWADELLVTRVIDGDTVEGFMEGRRIHLRLIGINTPELHDIVPCARAWARQARSLLTTLVLGKVVTLQYDPKRRADVYGRVLAYVYAGEIFINRELLRLGLASTSYVSGLQHRQALLTAEAAAKVAHLGMWGGS